MDDVRVHRNSSEPARLGALAYAQGSDVHLGPGQDEHLPHEAWHVVQQKQGRVKATMQMKGVAINDEAGLEREASAMGARAASAGFAAVAPAGKPAARRPDAGASAGNVVQREINPDWSAVTKVTVSPRTQVGVFFVTGADGTEYVVKFEPKAGPEAFASEFIRLMGGFGKGPETVLMNVDDQRAVLLGQTLGAMKQANKASGEALALLAELTKFKGSSFVVMEKVPGKTMHQDDQPDLTVFKNPIFVKSLGELAAFDVVLANYDRLLMGMNLGNILYDKSSGRLTGIDQTAREDEIALRGRDIVDDVLNAIYQNKLSKMATGIATLIDKVYGVKVNPGDLDTGFAAALFTMRSNLRKLPALMQSGVGVAAGAGAGATVGRLAAYLEAIEPKHVKDTLGPLVVKREIDIADRAKVPKQEVAKPKDDCFISTACVVARGLPDDCTELRELRAFRDGFLRGLPDGPDQIDEYYRIAPSIVAAIEEEPRSREIFVDLYEQLVCGSLRLIRAGRCAEAAAHYRALVAELKGRYLADPADRPAPLRLRVR